MKDLNIIFLIGRIVRDIEIRYTQTGKAIAKFSIANNDSFGSGENKKENVSYFDCVVWDKQAENCNKYLRKGSQVAIEGSLKQNRYTDKNGQNQSKIEISVGNIQFLDTKAKECNGSSANEMPIDPWKT